MCRPLASRNGAPVQISPRESPQVNVAAKIGPEMSVPTLCAIAPAAYSGTTGVSGNRATIAHRKETENEDPSAEKTTPATMRPELCASPIVVSPTMIKIQLPMESNKSF